MTWVDYCILAVLLISTVVGIIRGLTREVLGAGTWVLAFLLAFLFGNAMGGVLLGPLPTPALALAAGYALVFLGTLLAGAILTHFIGEAIRNAGYGSTDRTLGGGVGLIRGVVIVAAFIMIARAMGGEQKGWWQESMLVGRMAWLADGLQFLVPDAWLDALAPQTPPPSPPSP